jgi:hypothetical protein
VSIKKKIKISIIVASFGLLFLITLGLYWQTKVIPSDDKSSVLLPLGVCSDKFVMLNSIAAGKGENLAEHLGADKLVRLINN